MPGSGKAQQENILASRQSKVSMIFDIRYSTFGGKQHCEYQTGSIFGVSSGGGGGGGCWGGGQLAFYKIVEN